VPYVAGQPTDWKQARRRYGKQANIYMKIHRALSSILLACALGAGLAACGGSSSSSAPTASSPAASSPAASSTANAVAQIKANWIAFFNPKTPVAKKISLLQDGQQFASIIQSQASSGLASQVSAEVSKVTLVSATQATVTYSIVEGGKPVLSNQTGVAVNQGGTWKVGVASFCGLLALENGGKTSSLPAACRAAGQATPS
jgi:hypothetical protein